MRARRLACAADGWLRAQAAVIRILPKPAPIRSRAVANEIAHAATPRLSPFMHARATVPFHGQNSNGVCLGEIDIRAWGTMGESASLGKGSGWNIITYGRASLSAG
jgi:hypothetical protein